MTGCLGLNPHKELNETLQLIRGRFLSNNLNSLQSSSELFCLRQIVVTVFGMQIRIPTDNCNFLPQRLLRYKKYRALHYVELTKSTEPDTRCTTKTSFHIIITISATRVICPMCYSNEKYPIQLVVLLSNRQH